MNYFLQGFAVVVVLIGCVTFVRAIKEALKDDEYQNDYEHFEDDESLL